MTMINNVPDRNIYTLNLNDDSVALCIQNAREKIAEIKVLQEKFQPEYEKEKDFFTKAKVAFEAVHAQWTSLESDIAKQEVVLNALTHFKKSVDPNKKLAHVRKDEDIPAGTSKDMNVKWVAEAKKVLEEVKIFLLPDELWSRFVKDPAIVEACSRNKTKIEYMQSAAQTGLLKHATFVGRKRGTQVLCAYKGKIGLYDWLGDAGIPSDPNHLKQFLHIGHIGHENGTIINARRLEHGPNGRDILRHAIAK